MPLPQITGEFGLVADPEAKFSEKGNLWVRARVVAKDRKRDANGQWTDGDPCFLDLIAFGSIAENLIESAQKGANLVITGRLQMREWTQDDGTKRSSYQITADAIGMGLRWGPAIPQERGGQRPRQETQAPATPPGLGGGWDSTPPAPAQESAPPF